jgi:hypothetical protein
MGRAALATLFLAVAPIVATTTAATAAPVTAPASASISVTASAGVLPAADGNGAGNATQEADKALRTTVAKDLAGNSYQLSGGGTVNGSDIIKPEGTINQAIYEQLTSSAQTQFANDLMAKTDSYTEPTAQDYSPSLAKSSGVTSETKQNWFKELRSNSGLGSKLLTSTLARGVYADLDGGARWFAPFSGPLSTALGFLAILILAGTTISAVIDLAYITIPAFQVLSDAVANGGGNGNGGGGGLRQASAKLVSTAARKAVEAEENGQNAVWVYFKKAAGKYLAVGFTLCFLAYNLLWSLVGTAMDLVTGNFF